MTVKTIGIVGMGQLGRGIAACFVSKIHRVVVTSDGNEWRDATRNYISDAIADLVRHGRCDEKSIADWPARYCEASAVSDLRDCDFLIESVPEDLVVKRDVLRQLESAAAPTIPIATNTSSIPITVLQNEMIHPARLIGMHWAAPCHVTRFMEIIRGDKTDDHTASLTIDLAKSIGKEPCILNFDIAGFIVNRLAYAMYREALSLLEASVADVATIDRSFRDAIGLWASVAGPFRWMDLTGLPAYAQAMARLFPQLSNRSDVPPTMTRLVESGATGAATGRGFYNYTPEEAARWQRRFTDNVWGITEAARSGETKCD
jgi:3-hydroxybutyryl-CoA dehydrogenase